MEDARLVSGHGRNLSEKALAEAAAHCPKLFILCDKERTPAWIAGALVNSGLKDVRMAAGSFLTYPEEKILSGKPEAFLDKTFGALSLALVKNDRAVESSGFSLLEDQQFSRNKTPMTREEVRWIILGKLRLSESSVLWDIGARNRIRFCGSGIALPGGKGHCRGKKSPGPCGSPGKQCPAGTG